MKLNNKIIQKVQNTRDKPGLTTKNRFLLSFTAPHCKPVKKVKPPPTKASTKKAEKKPKKDVKVEKPKAKEKSKKTDYG